MQSTSRRDFLKLTGLSLTSLVANLALDKPTALLDHPQPDGTAVPEMKARVTIQAIYFYQEPDFKSPRLGTLERDTLVPIQEVIIPPGGPSYNPRWYRLEGGYIHSAYTQRVDEAHLNPVLKSIPTGGQLGELTVPFVQSQRKLRSGDWQQLYRLYYSSVYWITHLEEGPDGRQWYGLTDDRLHMQYYVPARTIRPIHAEELSPISADVPEKEKKIEVSIPEQTLTAYEGNQVVRIARISTGLHTENLPPDVLPTDTPAGIFHIQVKVPSRHMGDGWLTDDLDAYELLGVPWVSFFHSEGIGFHGTYWHDNFGRKMSHGCVNMKNEDAKWLYRWSRPHASASDWAKKGWGTLVKIFE